MKLLPVLLLCASTALAQIEMPPSSPTYTLSGTVGLAKVSVTYSRPSARGRTVFGDLVPFGEIWRTGANASTKVSFDMTVQIEGHEVPAGEYALYTIPGKETWTMILSRNTTHWGTTGYTPDEDFLRFELPAKSVSSHYETFTISFSDFTNTSAYLNLKWEKSKVKFKITNEVDAYVMAQITKNLIDGTPTNMGDFYSGASYYYDTDRDMKLAAQWIAKSIADSEAYWKYHLQAKILVRLGKKKEAIEAAKKSIALAENGVNPDYVRLNQKLIANLD